MVFTRNRRFRQRTFAAGAALALLLAACGGATEETTDQAAEPADTADEGDDTEGDVDDDAEEADDPDESFYQEGDLIEVIVPFSEGGGTDVLARTALPYLGEELGGVNFQVVNVPGGGAIPGVNEFSRRSADGYHYLMHSASSQIPGIFDEVGVEWSFDEQVPVAGFPLGGNVVVFDDAPWETAADLFTTEEQITYGGQAAAGGELRILLLFEIFDTNVNTVLGYGGSSETHLAWEQGETDVVYDTTPGYISNFEWRVEDGDVRNIMTFGFLQGGELVPDLAYPDVDYPGSVYEEVFGEPWSEAGEAARAYDAIAEVTIALNKTMVGMADSPPEALAEMRAAWERLLQDEEFLDIVDIELGGYPILVGDELDASWDSMTSTDVDEPAIQWLLDWAEETYEVNLQER